MPDGFAIERRVPDPTLVAYVDPTIQRYRDARFDAAAVKLLPGEHYVTAVSDAMIVTVLGSCVSACIRDPVIALVA